MSNSESRFGDIEELFYKKKKGRKQKLKNKEKKIRESKSNIFK
jgi:hypothetical protein